MLFLTKISTLSQSRRILILLFGILSLISAAQYGFLIKINKTNNALTTKNQRIEENIALLEDLGSNKLRLFYLNDFLTEDNINKLTRGLLSGGANVEIVTVKKTRPILLDDKNDDGLSSLHNVFGKDLLATDIEVTLLGDYFSIIKYLQSIESDFLHGLYWQNLTYDVVDYPVAKVALTIRTLGAR